MKLARLENWQYLVEMSGLRDSWNIIGNVFDHQRFPDGDQITISRVVAFDKKKMVIRTYSESLYLLGQCGGNLRRQINFIEEDVKEYVGNSEVNTTRP
jgi:hypothetical protein